MRIVVAGGGTAGHISPILAAVDELKRRDKSAEVLYVGQKVGMEADMARSAGIDFKGINAGKYRRASHASFIEKLGDTKNLALNVRDVGRSVSGLAASLRILKSYNPDVVFCKGGFVALPVGIAAKMLKIPLIIHESDATPGLGTKVLGRWADTIAVGFPPELYEALPAGRVIFTGNPVRNEIVHDKETRSGSIEHFFGPGSGKGLPVVLVIGGSQGAVAINDAVVESAKHLTEFSRIIHITGNYDYDRVVSEVISRKLDKEKYVIREFLTAEEMAKAYKASDLVISRAGANAITELGAVKKPVILIPNQLMAAHQVDNAVRLAEAGAVELMREDLLTAVNLTEAVKEIIESKGLQNKLVEELSKVYVPDSTSRLVDLIVKAARVSK